MAASVVYTNFAGQIAVENRGGTVKEYVPDTLGSTVALTTAISITDTWDYWPYGEVMTRTGSTPTPFTFVGVLGYFKDLLDKLLYVRTRHYQPNYGRWLTVDPLWPGEQPYSYPQNPVGHVDSSGLRPCTPLQALRCYYLCGSQNARYTGTCTAEDLPFGVIDVDCHCEPLQPDCSCSARRLAQLSLQIALSCQAPRKCGHFLAAPPDKGRCSEIRRRIALGLSCIYAQDALNKECFGGGDPGHKQKIKEAWNAINTCSRALAFNGCPPYR